MHLRGKDLRGFAVGFAVMSDPYDPCRDAYSDCSSRDVLEDDSVRSNDCMIADRDAAKYLGAGPYIYMAAENRRTRFGAASTYSHLLKQKTVRTDNRIRKNDHPVWMG